MIRLNLSPGRWRFRCWRWRAGEVLRGVTAQVGPMLVRLTWTPARGEA